MRKMKIKKTLKINEKKRREVVKTKKICRRNFEEGKIRNLVWKEGVRSVRMKIKFHEGAIRRPGFSST